MEIGNTQTARNPASKTSDYFDCVTSHKPPPPSQVCHDLPILLISDQCVIFGDRYDKNDSFHSVITLLRVIDVTALSSSCIVLFVRNPESIGIHEQPKSILETYFVSQILRGAV